MSTARQNTSMTDFTSLQQAYEYHCTHPSDINEHLPTLRQFADCCDVVVELGVRKGRSTSAFLASTAAEVYSYDLDLRPEALALQGLAAMEGRHFELHQGDSRSIRIPNCDLLFIDTWHVYEQLFAELTLHSSQVRRWIALHDTERNRQYGEHPDGRMDDSRRGIWQAVWDFLGSDIGKGWGYLQHHSNNNGLTILERRP